jgi:hypothetical protein
MKARSVEQCPSAENSGIFRMAENLTRAASPVFALMALLTLRYGDARDLVCGTASGAPWNGMITMYMLMCVAHLPPWLRLLSRR